MERHLQTPRPWMVWLLRFAGTYNLLAGLGMIFLYHEGLRMLELPKPNFVLPLQIMGALVAVFGIGYHMVAANPAAHRGVLLLGTLSKLFASTVAFWGIFAHSLSGRFAVGVLFSDVVYLPLFAIILMRLYAPADGKPQT